jgi:hypothetical protein
MQMTQRMRLDFSSILALFCWSCFGLFQLVSTYSLSQNTIESAEISRLFHQPNQPFGPVLLVMFRLVSICFSLFSLTEYY